MICPVCDRTMYRWLEEIGDEYWAIYMCEDQLHRCRIQQDINEPWAEKIFSISLSVDRFFQREENLNYGDWSVLTKHVIRLYRKKFSIIKEEIRWEEAGF